MKTKHSLCTSASMLLITLAVNLISCTKEELRLPLENAGNPGQTNTSAASIESNAKAKKHYIGERFGGGIVFYVTGDNHGLIADTVDLPRATWWDGKFKTTGAKGKSIGSGKSNTRKIISAQDPLKNFAALECYNSTRGGKTDWFLPSKDELNALFKQRHVVGIGGFAPYGYYSSSETDSSHVWWQGFSLGYQAIIGKNATLYVRAIRAF